MATTTVASGSWKRLPSVDVESAEAVFRAAMLLLVPEDQTQRKAFEMLMPYLYALRNKGCSWAQLTKLLTDCGFNLQLSTVRSYFSEMLATRQDICQERMNEQILLLAEMRKETKGPDMKAIAGKVSVAMDRQRASDASKIDSIFGSSGATSPQPQIRKTGLRPDPVQSKESPPSNGESDSGSFGLLKLKPSGQKITTSPAFFSLDDGPVVPDLKKQPSVTVRAAASPPAKVAPPPPKMICQKLEKGVAQIQKRNQVAAEVYRPGDLEHPAIPGLMLTLEQRLYGAHLEYSNLEDGEIRLETPEEKRFRVGWRRPLTMLPSRTGESFVQMDPTVFKNG